MAIIEFLLWSGAIMLVVFVGTAIAEGIKQAMNEDVDD